jgi:predicted transcriptional regulator
MTRDGWTFVTNHGHVLVCLAADPEVLVRDVAATVGITERAVQQIIGDLVEAGVVAKVRVGRRNHYLVLRERPLRHVVESGVTVGRFVDLMRHGGGDVESGAVREVVAHLHSQGL